MDRELEHRHGSAPTHDARKFPHLFIRRMREQITRAGEFFLDGFVRAILFDYLAEAAMLLGGFPVRRRIRQQLWR